MILIPNLRARDWGWLSATRPDRYSPDVEPQYPLHRTLSGFWCRYGRVRKISIPEGFEPQTFHRVDSRCINYAIPTAITLIDLIQYIYIYIYIDTHTHIYIYIYTCICSLPLHILIYLGTFTVNVQRWPALIQTSCTFIKIYSNVVCVCVCVCLEWCFFTRIQIYSFLLINTQRTSETVMQYAVLTKLIIYCRVLLEKLIALQIIQKVQYRSHSSAPPVPIQRQFNPTHILHPPFFKLNFHTTVSSTSNSSQRSRPYRYSHHNLVCIFVSNVLHKVRPRNLFGLIVLTTFDDE